MKCLLVAALTGHALLLAACTFYGNWGIDEAVVASNARAARPARRTPARRAPATPPPTKRVKVKREGERRSVRKVATPHTYNERHLEAAAWAGRGTRDDPFVAA